MKLAIIDYGMGNLHSVIKALEKVAPEVELKLAITAKSIAEADRILLPGQGAIAGCMQALGRLELIDALKQAAKTKPFLGICIGPQLMMQHSEENGGVSGLNLFENKVIKFNPQDKDGDKPIKIPHMGWNTISQTKAHFLWQDIEDNSYFYYVHSYHIDSSPHTIGTSTYGVTFPAAIAHDNIAGLQAHPEKSADAGLRFLYNFIHWQP